jgi:membrane protein
VALLGAPALVALLDGRLSLLIYVLRIPVGALFMTLLLAILYYVLPNVRQPFHLVTPGSIAAVVLWLLGSLVFSLYTTRFASYEVAYGALGGVIVLLLWMWISSIAVLLGAEINAILEPSLQPAEVRQTRPPLCPPPTPVHVAPASSTEPAAPPSTADPARPPTPRG